MNNSSKIKLLIFLTVIFFIAYLAISESINNNLYPVAKVRDAYITLHQSAANTTCFYSNPPSTIIWDGKEKLLRVYSTFEKRCDFEQAYFYVYTPPSKLYTYEINENLKHKIKIRDLSDEENGGAEIILNGSDMEPYANYGITLIFNITENFHNFFWISANGVRLGEIRFYYDDSLKGYSCDENCFFAVDGESKIMRDESIARDSSKRYVIKSDYKEGGGTQVIFRFYPKSKWYALLQKIADNFILGTIVVLLYEIISTLIIKKLK